MGAGDPHPTWQAGLAGNWPSDSTAWRWIDSCTSWRPESQSHAVGVDLLPLSPLLDRDLGPPLFVEHFDVLSAGAPVMRVTSCLESFGSFASTLTSLPPLRSRPSLRRPPGHQALERTRPLGRWPSRPEPRPPHAGSARAPAGREPSWRGAAPTRSSAFWPSASIADWRTSSEPSSCGAPTSAARGLRVGETGQALDRGGAHRVGRGALQHPGQVIAHRSGSPCTATASERRGPPAS